MACSKYITTNEKETFDLGVSIGETLRKGDIITLDGDLGAGKTVLTKGICSYFNVKDYVTSPTYTIVNEYSGDIKIYHFDIYRLCEEEELYNIGFYDYLEDEGISIVEWAVNIPEAFEGYNIIKITVKKTDSANEEMREITVERE
jgi:tRNA threonylcarbamoyladenosine biosynthesis protein TsaE